MKTIYTVVFDDSSKTNLPGEHTEASAREYVETLVPDLGSVTLFKTTIERIGVASMPPMPGMLWN